MRLLRGIEPSFPHIESQAITLTSNPYDSELPAVFACRVGPVDAALAEYHRGLLVKTLLSLEGARKRGGADD